jgi:hypothetical protein
VPRGDVLYVRSGDDEATVLATAGLGGIGPLAHDTVAGDPDAIGRFALRGPLITLLAAGARPVAVTGTVSVAGDPVGDGILGGVRAEADAAGIGADAVLGATAEDVATTATGVGVTVVGIARLGELRAGSARAGDTVFLVGRPRSAPGDELRLDDEELLTVPAIRAVLDLPRLRELLPVTSAGLAAAVTTIAGGASVERRDDWPVADDQSGGPSTACLVAGDADPAAIAEATGLPVWALADLRSATKKGA